MEIIERRGEWTLIKIKKGLYSITKHGEAQKLIITDSYRCKGTMLNPAGRADFDSVKVGDSRDAKLFFENFTYHQQRG